VVHHPVWFIFSWGGAHVQPLEAESSLDRGCVGPSHMPLWEAHRIRDFWDVTSSRGTQGNDLDNVELVFLHLVGFVGHVVHSGASGARNVNALFFMLGWDWHGFNKMRVGTRCAKL
jgi:hypothetical protein